MATITKLNLSHLFFSTRSYMETKGWDVFRVLPPEQDSSSEAMNKRCMAITVRVLKVIGMISHKMSLITIFEIFY